VICEPITVGPGVEMDAMLQILASLGVKRKRPKGKRTKEKA
jgi:hypothetical protein